MQLVPGRRASVDVIVAENDTAMAVGSGDVPVLATPRLLALAEAAALAAIRPSLDPGVTSVGTSALIEHVRASPVGGHVVVEAQLTEVDDRRLTFSFIAWREESGTVSQDRELVGEGKMDRVLVDRDTFIARAERRGSSYPGVNV